MSKTEIFLCAILVIVTVLISLAPTPSEQESMIKQGLFAKCVDSVKIPVGECSRLFKGEK